MKLKEFEGMELFRASGIKTPEAYLVKDVKELQPIESDVVVKVQTLMGGRGKNNGIKFCQTQEELVSAVEQLFDFKPEKVEEILVQEKVDMDEEYYLGFMFDTKLRSPVIILSKDGGIDIEDNKNVVIKEINVLKGLPSWKAREFCEEAGFTGKNIIKVASAACKLYKCFKKNDMRMVEINPLIKNKAGDLIAADAVVILDDDALKRHKFEFPERTGFRKKTAREVRANDIDREDYRGVSGKTFIDIGGDIATMSSGGGGSVTAMDALLTYGATLSNYTEYSGNPPPEKVEKLTKVVLEPDNLCGLFIVGGRANFTRVDITLKAILDVILEKKIDFPIVVRRAGPKYKEALKMFREAAKKHNLNVKVYDDSIPITVAAKEMAELAAEYKRKK